MHPVSRCVSWCVGEESVFEEEFQRGPTRKSAYAVKYGLWVWVGYAYALMCVRMCESDFNKSNKVLCLSTRSSRIFGIGYDLKCI